MLLHLGIYTDTVNGIDRTALEFVDITCYYFRSLLHIRYHDGHLMLVKKLSKSLESAVSDFEMPI